MFLSCHATANPKKPVINIQDRFTSEKKPEKARVGRFISLSRRNENSSVNRISSVGQSRSVPVLVIFSSCWQFVVILF